MCFCTMLITRAFSDFLVTSWHLCPFSTTAVALSSLWPCFHGSTSGSNHFSRLDCLVLSLVIVAGFVYPSSASQLSDSETSQTFQITNYLVSGRAMHTQATEAIAKMTANCSLCCRQSQTSAKGSCMTAMMWPANFLIFDFTMMLQRSTVATI